MRDIIHISADTPDPRVQIQLLHEHEDSLGVARIWQMRCTLPGLSLASFGLLGIGLDSMATRLQRMSVLSLSGHIMSEELSVEPQDTGSLNLVMRVAQYERARGRLLEQ